jgi:hypothetical protein
MQSAIRCPYFQKAFGWCVPIGGLAGLVGLGGGAGMNGTPTTPWRQWVPPLRGFQEKSSASDFKKNGKALVVV